jgi:pilus assembly protein Flp/PilA
LRHLFQTTKAHVINRSLLHQLFQEECGQDLIEYALVAALVGLAAVGAMRGLSTKIATSFNTVGNNLTSAI